MNLINSISADCIPNIFMENFISENISFFVRNSNLKQDEFGLLFDLKKGVVNQYMQKKSLPKIETIQKICKHFKVSIDDFINLDLSSKGLKITGEVSMIAEPEDKYSSKDALIEAQKETIKAQKQLIKNLEVQLGHAS